MTPADGPPAAEHPLGRLLGDVARGAHPPADGRVTLLPQHDPRVAGVLAFTGHHVVVADVEPAWVRRQLPSDDDLGAPLAPPFLTALAAETGLAGGAIDAVLVAAPLDELPAAVVLEHVEAFERAEPEPHAYRVEVSRWTCHGGSVTLGRGLAGRWEVAVEVEVAARNHGLGRALFAAARHLVTHVGDADDRVWAQVAPGNAASVRALLDAGYRPGGAEALLVATS